MKRLKVLICAYACNPLSDCRLHPGEDITGWRFVEQISRFHEVWVLTHSYNKHALQEASAQELLGKVSFHFIDLTPALWWLYNMNIGRRLYYYFWQIAAFAHAYTLHRKVGFDLFHHITFGNDWIPSFTGAFLRVPFFWGPFGGGQKVPRTLFSTLTLRGKAAEILRDSAQYLARRILFPYRNSLLQRAQTVLVCNRQTHQRIPERFREKTKLFPLNGVLLEELQKQEPSGNNMFYILSAGRLDRIKGLDLALSSFALFRKKYPHSLFEILGSGPEEKRLKRLAHRLGIAQGVVFTPWVRREEVRQKLHKADVFLFLSLRDGGGAVVVEAMAAGTPVVCLDTAGPGFHIQPEWGIKILPQDADTVVENVGEALATLHNNPALRKELGRRALQRAEEFYLWDRLGEKITQVYQEARL